MTPRTATVQPSRRKPLWARSITRAIERRSAGGAARPESTVAELLPVTLNEDVLRRLREAGL